MMPLLQIGHGEKTLGISVLIERQVDIRVILEMIGLQGEETRMVAGAMMVFSSWKQIIPNQLQENVQHLVSRKFQFKMSKKNSQTKLRVTREALASPVIWKETEL